MLPGSPALCSEVGAQKGARGNTWGNWSRRFENARLWTGPFQLSPEAQRSCPLIQELGDVAARGGLRSSYCSAPALSGWRNFLRAAARPLSLVPNAGVALFGRIRRTTLRSRSNTATVQRLLIVLALWLTLTTFAGRDRRHSPVQSLLGPGPIVSVATCPLPPYRWNGEPRRVHHGRELSVRLSPHVQQPFSAK